MLWSPIATEMHARERRHQAWRLGVLRSTGPLVLILGCATLGGCGGFQSMLNPRGAEAEALSRLFWFFTLVCGVI